MFQGTEWSAEVKRLNILKFEVKGVVKILLSYSCHKLYSFGRISTVSVKDVIKMSTPN